VNGDNLIIQGNTPNPPTAGGALAGGNITVAAGDAIAIDAGVALGGNITLQAGESSAAEDSVNGASIFLSPSNATGAESVDGYVSVTQGKMIIGTSTAPINSLDVVGNISCSVITASLHGTASWAVSSSWANNLTSNNPLTSQIFS
jgi:hypothetical protein